jgi:hypothetical protein
MQINRHPHLDETAKREQREFFRERVAAGMRNANEMLPPIDGPDRCPPIHHDY